MDEGDLACFLCLLSLCFSFGGVGGSDLGEGGRDDHRGVVEGGAGVADGDADELDAYPTSSEGAKEVVYFSVFLRNLQWQLRSL